jgi:hypothetical protein
VVKAAVDAYAAAIDKIADYAETGAVAPAYTDYAAAGVIGVDATNVAAINSAINAQAGADTTVGNANDRDGADTAAKVQTIVDAYKDILVAADGTDANTSGAAIPSQADYQAIGITGTTAASAALLSDVIDGKATADVDTIAKIQALATAAKVVISYDDPSTDIPPTKDQINVLVQGQTVGGNPVPAVTDAALAQVQAAIDAANSDGTPLATQADVAAVVKAAMDAYTAALNTIADYAETGAVAPADTDYTAAGVIGVNSGNLAAINSAINAQPGTDTTVGNANDRDAADTTAEVQAIVNAYQAILDEANGAGADLSAQDPTVTQYAAIGVTGVDAGAEETLLGDVIGRKVTADVDTVGEVQTLADTVAKVIAAAGSGTAPTESELTSLGLSGINAQNIAAVQAAIAATADNGSGVDTLTKLQALIASANDLPTGGVTITGTVKVGETLTASTTEVGNVLADRDGLGTLSYKWFANGTEISGATGSTYQLAAGDLGKTITAQVSYTDAGGTATQVTSGATAAVAAAFTAGDPTLDLTGSGVAGVTGKLIAPVHVDGKWYYYWDRSGNGDNTGADDVLHDTLDSIFNQDINGNVNTTVLNADGNYGTTDVYRYATINGVKLALPTVGGIPFPGGTSTTNAPGTAIDNNPTGEINPTYDGLLAVWDAFNGTGTGTLLPGIVPAWFYGEYWTATAAATGHGTVNLDGKVREWIDQNAYSNVALQVLPVVIDLNRDGVLSYGQVTMDVNGDGALDLTKWAGAQDGVLVWDKFGDGLVHDNSQYAFAQYATTYENGFDINGKAPTDLSGLAEAFDSNQDGVFNANDAKFAEFKVWQDANQNGVSDEGEVRSLADWGITEINLVSDGVQRTPVAGVTEAGRTTATATDGSHVLVSDAAFAYNALDYTVTGNAMNLLGADMHLDLSSVVAVHSNVTAMDLTGTGANTIKLSLADVLSVATDASIANGVHKLTLTGDANDTVELDLSQWANTGNTVTEGDHTYAVYNASSSAAAQLLIDQHMVMVNHA